MSTAELPPGVNMQDVEALGDLGEPEGQRVVYEDPEEPEEKEEPETVVKTIITKGKGKKAESGKILENKEALAALSRLGASGGSRIWVERVEPSTYQGRKVQTGRIVHLTLSPSEISDAELPRTLPMLGKYGRVLRLGCGNKSIPLDLAGGDLSKLDFDDSAPAAQQTVVGIDAFGRPVMSQLAATTPAPVAGLNFSPFGFQGQQQTPESIAKLVAEMLKKEGDQSKMLMEIEEKRAAREERERKDRIDREEKAEERRREREEKAEKERKDREERYERERRETAEREERRRSDREKEERQERRDREERLEKERAAQAERDRQERLEREKREEQRLAKEEAARERAHQLSLEQAKEQRAAMENLAKTLAGKDESFFDKWMKLKALEPAKDEFKSFERAASLISSFGGQRSTVGEVMEHLPAAIESLTGLKTAVPNSVMPSGAAMHTQTGQPAQPQAQQIAQNPPPARMDLVELLDGLKSCTDAISKGVTPAQAVAALRQPREKGGTPNLVLVCAQREPTEVMGEIMKQMERPDVPAEAKATIAAFGAVVKEQAGLAWIMAFFAEARK